MKGILISLSENQSIFIYNHENGKYISPEGTVKYRNIGENFDIKMVHEKQASIRDGLFEIYSASGKRDLYFPEEWLNPDIGKIKELKEKGILQ